MDQFLALGNATTYQGLDLSEEMVRHAHERIKALGKTDLASVQQGDILHWQSDVQYDLVIAINLIYFFPTVGTDQAIVRFSKARRPVAAWIPDSRKYATITLRQFRVSII